MLQKILIIEDDLFSANLYKFHFEKAGYVTEVAMDGASALHLADSFRPHLIILDLILPRLDGFTLLQLFGHTHPHRHTPIIVISNLNQSTDIDRCLKLGAKKFIIKDSINYTDLITQAKQLL